MIKVSEMKPGQYIHYRGSTRGDRNDGTGEYANECDLVGQITKMADNKIDIIWINHLHTDTYTFNYTDRENPHAWINFTDFISEKEYLALALKLS